MKKNIEQVEKNIDEMVKQYQQTLSEVGVIGEVLNSFVNPYLRIFENNPNPGLLGSFKFGKKSTEIQINLLLLPY